MDEPEVGGGRRVFREEQEAWVGEAPAPASSAAVSAVAVVGAHEVVEAV